MSSKITPYTVIAVEIATTNENLNQNIMKVSAHHTFARWCECESVLMATKQDMENAFSKIGPLDYVLDGTRHAKFCSDQFRGFCSPNT